MLTPTNAVFDLTCELIRRVSVTPEDAGCQEIIGQRLANLGFSLRQLNAHGVHNLWASRGQAVSNLWAIRRQSLGNLWAIFEQSLGNL